MEYVTQRSANTLDGVPSVCVEGERERERGGAGEGEGEGEGDD